jgi:hypothetical protein
MREGCGISWGLFCKAFVNNCFGLGEYSGSKDKKDKDAG